MSVEHLGNGFGTEPLSLDLLSSSQGQQLSTEALQHLLERALTPLVDEVKQRSLTPPACPSCQRLHKKILVPESMGYHVVLYFSCKAGVGDPGHKGTTHMWQEGRGWTEQQKWDELALKHGGKNLGG